MKRPESLKGSRERAREAAAQLLDDEEVERLVAMRECVCDETSPRNCPVHQNGGGR